jgi:hypothetical protein
MKRERRDIPIKLNWYSMHGGPKNIEELSGYFKTYLEYELLYREWSGIAHGINIILENIEVIDRDTASISQIRIPGSAFEVTTTAINFALEVIPFFINRYAPHKQRDAREWFAKEYVPLKKSALLKNRIIVT